jgi:hypothetical protein
MVTKAGVRREERAKRERIRNGSTTCGAIVIGLVPFVLPKTSYWIVSALIAALILSFYPIWNCWGFQVSWTKRITFFLVSVAILSSVGVLVWPRIVVGPNQVPFSANTSQQYDFAVTNQTENDAYEISIPIDVQGQSEDNFSLYLWPSSEDRRSVSLAPENANEYSYCLDKSNKPFILANITHLEPHQIQRFTLIHKTGPSLIAKVGIPTKLDIPKAYDKHVNADGTMSETGTIYIPAAYRCHVVLQAKQSPR